MTVHDIIQRVQGKRVGVMNRYSAKYAQTLIHPGEKISVAVVANVATRGERFPGVVILTDQRIMAVCGLPGIKRSIVFDINQLDKCEESPSAINYKATFYSGKNAFSFTVNPEIGETFSRYIAVLNGAEDEFDAVEAPPSNTIFNPTLVRAKLRAREAKKRERAKREAAQDSLRAQLEEKRKAQSVSRTSDSEDASTQEVAKLLERQLEEALGKGLVDDTDPTAVAARLAKELADEETKPNS